MEWDIPCAICVIYVASSIISNPIASWKERGVWGAYSSVSQFMNRITLQKQNRIKFGVLETVNKRDLGFKKMDLIQLVAVEKNTSGKKNSLIWLPF